MAAVVRDGGELSLARAPGTAALRHWTLDPAVSYLNHGSFGACPTHVLEVQARLRGELEANPMRFLVRELEDRLDGALATLGDFVGAAGRDLAFVGNATAGVNAVLRSLPFSPGDEILTTNHAYGACAATLAYVAQRTGARVVVVEIPFPLTDGGEARERILRHAGPKVRLALIDHVTSPTALVWPIAAIVQGLAERGIDTLVDGAHAPGMLELDLRAIGAAYYVGDCHKWICAPKGAGFLHVRPDRHGCIVPVAISHGWSSDRSDRIRFRQLFDWTGTWDPTAALSVPAALECMAGIVPGGWDQVRAANRRLAIRARELLCEALGLDRPAPEALLGSMAAVPLGPRLQGQLADPLQEALWKEERIEIPLLNWGPHRILRLSAQLYNSESDFERLAEAISVRIRSP